MKTLNFPSYQFSIEKREDQLFIFDEIRRKWLVLTPEEWVRQHVIFYLVDQRMYPSGLISVEKTVVINGMQKRFDILCNNTQGNPIMLIECKAPEVKISQDTFNQAFNYNHSLVAKAVIATNGMDLLCALKNKNNQWEVSNKIPFYEDLIN